MSCPWRPTGAQKGSLSIRVACATIPVLMGDFSRTAKLKCNTSIFNLLVLRREWRNLDVQTPGLRDFPMALGPCACALGSAREGGDPVGRLCLYRKSHFLELCPWSNMFPIQRQESSFALGSKSGQVLILSSCLVFLPFGQGWKAGLAFVCCDTNAACGSGFVALHMGNSVGGLPLKSNCKKRFCQWPLEGRASGEWFPVRFPSGSHK